MTSLEEFGNLKLESDVVNSGISMVGVELTPLGDVSLGVWIGGLPGLFDGVAHILHDADQLHGLNVEVVF